MADVIWDLHLHHTGVPGNTPEERLRNILQYADRMGIERLCLYMGMEYTHNPLPAGIDLRVPGQILMAPPSQVPAAGGLATYGPVATAAVAELPAAYLAP